MKIYVVLQGCDDKTIIPMDVSDNQLEFLSGLSKDSKKFSTYGCMPVMKIMDKQSMVDEYWFEEEDFPE